MEKRVLFTELDDRGSHLRKEITPTAVVTDKRRFPTAQFWDANKTYDVIVADATSASDTLEKAEKNLNNEIARALHAENALSDRIDDLLGIDAEDIEDLKQLVEDLDPETGILSVIEQNKDDINNLADDVDKLIDDISVTIDNANGYDYVDLGLPSGTLWATMNIGATSETDCGNYYQYGKGSSQYNETKNQLSYSGTENPLSSSADTAKLTWGGNWHMPTAEQLNELIEYTTHEDATIGGVSGCKFTAQNGNYIFVPNSGYYIYGSIQQQDIVILHGSTPGDGSSSVRLSTDHNATGLVVKTAHGLLSMGFPVRAVLDGNPTTKTLGTTILDSERAAWNAKANASDYYTKAEIDAMLQLITNA